jgi:Fis family transcriptional regulator
MQDQLGTLVLQMYHGGILYSEALREFKKLFIITVLRENEGNQIRAARELHKHRNTLRRLIMDLEIDAEYLQAQRRPARSEHRVRSGKKMRPVSGT